MKLTKRMKSSIIQGIIVNIFLLFILAMVILFFLYPRFTEIEDKKSTLVTTYNKLQSISTAGISYGDFKTSIKSADIVKDNYVSNLIKNVTGEFYVENMTNTGSQQYNVFLDTLKEDVFLQQSLDEYIDRDKTLSAVLPVYDEKNIFSDEGLSDFFFINYIENILYSFNLSSDGEIGIGGLEKQGGSEVKQEDTLQEDIYSIPLALSIVGQKKDIVDFIHYFENVGGVYTSESGLKTHTDSFISKKLDGMEDELDYNIYKNQIADITRISLQDYPDSSSLKTPGLISAMKGSQSRERLDIEVDLAFYVVGIPGYKMEKYITDFLASYDSLLSQISSSTLEYTNQSYKFNNGEEILAIKNLQSLENIMTTLREDITQIRKAVAKRENIQKTYEDSLTYVQQISKIEANYNAQLQILTK